MLEKNSNKQFMDISSMAPTYNFFLSEEVWMCYNKITNETFRQICSETNVCHSKRAELYNNQNCELIKCISNIKFPNLKLLDLRDNQLMTIQEIVRVNMPFVQRINIGWNDIRQLKVMRKGKWKHLCLIYAGGNKILQANKLTQLMSKQLTSVILQVSQKSREQVFDTNWIIKLQTRKMTEIQILSEQRIRTLEKYLNYRKKHLNIKIKGLPVQQLRFPFPL